MSKIFVVSSPRWSRFRFYPVEALCRDALSHSTPPLLFFVPHSRGALWKECSRPAVMQKVRETAQQPLTPLLRKKQHPFSRFAILSASSSEDSRCCPDHRLFYTPAHHVAQTNEGSFPPHAPPKSLRWFGTHGLRPCKTATKMSDTIRQPVCTMPILTPSSYHGTNCPAFSCHTSCIQ